MNRTVLNWPVRQTTVGIVWCVALLAGLALARVVPESAVWYAIFMLVCAFIFRAKYRSVYVLLGFAGFLLLGLWRGGVFMHKMQPYNDLFGSKVVLTATADSDAVYGKQKQLSFTVRKVQFTSPEKTAVPGVIKINGFGELAVYKGDVLHIEGKLYKTLGSNQAAMYFAQFKRTGGQSSLADEFRRRFTAGMQTALPEPTASFGMGLLVGQRSTLPDTITLQLKMVGLMHIVAVSGYNLTIILNFAHKLFEKRSKRLTMLVALGLMAAFLLCTGMSASIVRAAVVSSLGLVAWYVGRRVRPLLLILLAAALTASVYPVYLWSDMGWYLSFLAFYGILVLAPLIVERIWKQRQPNALVAIALETLCAEVMTLPLILYIFGQMSFVGLLANVLVVVLIPLAMLLSFVAGMAGWLLGATAGWLAWPAQLLLTYMLDVAAVLSHIPHAFTTGVSIHLFDMLALYALLLLLVAFLTERKKWYERWHSLYASVR